ncbi:MAG: AAA family ATPase [Flavobacteriales bacterium]|nr:AAA family ATPase [Flavobacteriales bacterium]
MTIYTHVGFSKGGVKKTTTVISLALRLAELDKKVLIIDLDGQCDAGRMLDVSDEDTKTCSAHLYMPDADVVPKRVTSWSWRGSKEDVGSIDVIPANQGKLADMARKSDFALINNFIANTHRIGDDYDFVLFDTPPSLDINQVAGLSAATNTILPLSCDFNSCGADKVKEYLKVIRLVKTQFNKDLKNPHVILTDVDMKGKLTQRYVAWAQDFFGSSKVDGFVEHSTVIPNSFDASQKKSVWFKPPSGNDRVKGNAFKLFVESIIERLV